MQGIVVSILVRSEYMRFLWGMIEEKVHSNNKYSRTKDDLKKTFRCKISHFTGLTTCNKQ
jgi:hypothetical protein